MSDRIEPVRKEVRVPLAVEDAFALFTDKVSSWWPLATHSIGEKQARTAVFESKVGGRIYEILDDGTEHDWGRVVELDRPNSVLFTWHPGRSADTAGTVEVRFAADGDNTIVRLVHDGWEKLGAKAAETREGYDSGWDFVLGQRYVERARTVREGA